MSQFNDYEPEEREYEPEPTSEPKELGWDWDAIGNEMGMDEPTPPENIGTTDEF